MQSAAPVATSFLPDKRLIVVGAVLVSLLCFFFLPQPQPVRAGLAIFLLAAILWLTEAIDITFTALLIPVMAILFQVMPVKQALADFSNPVIFLFLGGFALAAALSRHGIAQSIGQAVLKVAGTNPVRAAYLLFAATGFMSMWISNTATVAMMLPIALGICSRFHDPELRTSRFLLLGTAYSASIGGMATLVGSPPNAIAASNQQITFVQWLAWGLPAALMLLPLMVLLLKFLLKPSFELTACTADERLVPGQESQPATAASPHRTLTLVVFALTVSGWIFSSPLSSWLGVSKDFDAWVAVIAILLLGVSGAIHWDDVEKKTSWGILLLFGGGMTLSSVLDHTGTSAFIASQLKSLLAGAPTLVAIVVIAAFVVFLTELVSNTACAALIIPLLVPVSSHFGVPPVLIAVLVAIASSAAFMLPVATPPNALVFGTGLIPQRVMMRTGFHLNLVSILVLSVLGYGYVLLDA